MPRKPNYRAERAERERSKQAKKDEKLRRQQDRAAPPSDEDAAGRPDRPEPPVE